MLLRAFHCVSQSPNGRGSRRTRRPFQGFAAIALLAMGSVFPAEAGNPAHSSRVAQATVAAAPTPRVQYKITKRPHLLAVGPMTLDVKPLAGPRVRLPPLLPPPKVVEPDPVEEPVSPEPGDTNTMPKPAEPSAFSPDAPHTLLPAEKPAPTPVPEKKIEPTESVLVPADSGEPDLKDAIMYFETPVGPHGSRVTIPMIPSVSPAAVPQPESRATYRKDKE